MTQHDVRFILALRLLFEFVSTTWSKTQRFGHRWQSSFFDAHGSLAMPGRSTSSRCRCGSLKLLSRERPAESGAAWMTLATSFWRPNAAAPVGAPQPPCSEKKRGRRGSVPLTSAKPRQYVASTQRVRNTADRRRFDLVGKHRQCFCGRKYKVAKKKWMHIAARLRKVNARQSWQLWEKACALTVLCRARPSLGSRLGPRR